MGNCKDCMYRDRKGFCSNDKIEEDWSRPKEERVDCLIYSYNEGGAFWVGEDFGCVHFYSIL